MSDSVETLISDYSNDFTELCQKNKKQNKTLQLSDTFQLDTNLINEGQNI